MMLFAFAPGRSSFLRGLLFSIVMVVLVPGVEAATATWDRNPESNIAGYVLSYGTQPDVHTVTVNVGNVTSYQFFPPVGYRYYVVVQAYDTNGVYGPKSDEAIYDTSGGGTQNQAPTLQQPANQSTMQSAAASLALVGADPESAPLSYSATGLPAGLAVNAGTGVIAGSPTTVGSYNVTATVSDGSLTATRTFTWTVTASSAPITVNLSPSGATTIRADATNYASASLMYSQTWPTNRAGGAILLKFDLSQIPANAVIQSATLQMSLARTDSVNDTYVVSMHQIINRNADPTRATGLTYNGTNAWTTTPCCTAPMAQADISAARSTLAVDRTLGAKSWDALTVVRSWQTAPSTNYGMLMNADLTKPGDRYRAFSSMTAVAAERPVLRVTYSVSGPPSDSTAPTVSMTAPSNNATVQGTSVTVSATASDNVGVAGVQFRLNGVNLGSEDTTAPYSTVWNTTTAANGAHVLTAIARDAAGNTSTSSAVAVTVFNPPPNSAPTLTQPANQTTAEGTAVSLALQAADPNNNPLTYSVTGLPSGLSVNTTTGVISGTPTFTSAGAYSVAATVSDGSLSQSRTFTWTVTNTNRQPALVQPANQSGAEGAAVSVALSGSDPDGDAITYAATGLPAGVSVNASTGVISGTPTFTSEGIYTVTASVSDGSLSQSRTFTWTVTNTNRQPLLTQPANQSSAEGSAVSMILEGSDPDGGSLTYSATGLPAGLGVNASTGAISGTPTFTSEGTYTITATVSDGSLSQSRTFTWTVTNTNREPLLAPVADQTGEPGNTVSLQVSASDPDGTAVTYAANSLPPGLTIDASTGLISGTLGVHSTGIYDIVVTVSDGQLTATQSFVWSVDGVDLPVRGDFDGDGRSDPATYRPATGEWRVWLSGSAFAPVDPFVWGQATDIPVTADYDGDGRTDFAIYRPSTGTWFVLQSTTNYQSQLQVQWGDPDDRPLAIDYDNDGRADLALPRFGGFVILLSGSNYTGSVTVR